MDRSTYVKERSLVALAIILGSFGFISQPIEIRATGSAFEDNRGLPSEQRDRWKSWASIGAAALEGNRYDVAIRYLTAALDGDAKNEDAAYLHILRGDAYRGKGDSTKAAADYARPVNFAPRNSAAYRMRGRTYDRMGNYKAAASDYAKGIALSPDDDTLLNSIAWLRATCPEASVRDGREAVRAGTRACEMTSWRDSTRIDTLAAAHAEIGDFAQAVKLQQQALQLRSTIAPDRRQGMQERLVSYQRRKPYREPAWLRARR
jgi:tetratricopeptide (TPR) repeat protein